LPADTEGRYASGELHEHGQDGPDEALRPCGTDRGESDRPRRV